MWTTVRPALRAQLAVGSLSRALPASTRRTQSSVPDLEQEALGEGRRAQDARSRRAKELRPAELGSLGSESPGLAFDAPLLADSLALGAGSSLQIGGSRPSHTRSAEAPGFPAALQTPQAPQASQPARADFARPDRRAVAFALQPAQAVPTPPPQEGSLPRQKQELPRLRLPGEEESDWPEDLQAEFQLAFERESRLLAERRAAEMRPEISEEWASIAGKLAGEWEAVHKGRSGSACRLRFHVIEEDGKGGLRTKSTRIGRAGCQETAEVGLWLNSTGSVMWGKGDVVLDMTCLTSSTLRWEHSNGTVWEWVRRRRAERSVDADAEEGGPKAPNQASWRWTAVPFREVKDPADSQKAYQKASKRLAMFVLESASRQVWAKAEEGLTSEAKRAQDEEEDAQDAGLREEEEEMRAAWEAAYSAAKERAEKGDPIAVAGELAFFEDRLDEGNYLRVRSAESFWQRTKLDITEANLVLLSHPAVQERVFRCFRSSRGAAKPEIIL
ncbi:unnamed protein product, partial [Polarella glacialis]